MLILGCDPGKTNCAIVVLDVNPIFELKNDDFIPFNEYTIIYSHVYNLSCTSTTVSGIILEFCACIVNLKDLYKVELAFVEVQGFKQGKSIMMNNVYNNIIQAAFITFWVTNSIDTRTVNPQKWRQKFGLNKIKKTAGQYRELCLLSNVINYKLLRTDHEFDAAMIAIAGYELK